MIGLVDRIKKTAPAPDTHRAVKMAQCQNKSICADRTNKPPDPAQTIPEPSPAGLGPEYENLWHRAWKLANEIDNPDGAPIEKRRARLPELVQMRDRMAEIENGLTNVSNNEEPTAPSDSEEIKQIKQDTCPAKCKRSGKCYGKAYFEGKPGRAAECDPAKCDRHPGIPKP